MEKKTAARPGANRSGRKGALPGGGIDLHLHSFCSDGTMSPEAIAREALKADIGIIALTDHDTVDGVQEAERACREMGLLLVPGVELSVGLDGDEVHILGYGLDTKSKVLRHTLSLLAAERERRMEKMVTALQHLGLPVALDEIKALAGGSILSRLHLSVYLEQKGLIEEREQAFSKYIGAGRPAYVGRNLLSLQQAIGLIIEAGGVAVFAHPGVTGRDDLIDYLLRLGVRGIEAYYPKHTPGEVSRYLKMCRRHDVLAIGGSDFHGRWKPEISIGAATTPREEFEKLKQAIKF